MKFPLSIYGSFKSKPNIFILLTINLFTIIQDEGRKKERFQVILFNSSAILVLFFSFYVVEDDHHLFHPREKK